MRTRRRALALPLLGHREEFCRGATVASGTHIVRSHNPVLCRLSYARRGGGLSARPPLSCDVWYAR